MSRETRQAVREEQSAFKKANSNLAKAKKKYRLENRKIASLKATTPEEKRYVGQKRRANRTLAEKEIKDLKDKKKVANRKKRQAIERNGGSLPQKIGRTAHRQMSLGTDAALSEDDFLADIASTRQTIRQTHVEIRAAKSFGKYGVKVTKHATKATYNVANRTYNLTRGRGFTRTPVNNRWETKLKNRYQRLRSRMKASKFGKAGQKAKKVASHVSKPFLSVLKNPLSAKSYLIVLASFFIIAFFGLIFGGGGTTVSQNEFELSETWTYLSKIDRAKSTDKVDYWTNIDEIMMFMGYKYADYKLDGYYNLKTKTPYESAETYRQLLDKIWDGLNKDKDNLKTMEDLYTTSKSRYLKLSQSEIDEYKEIKEQAQDVGYYITYNDIDSPLSNQDDGDSLEPIKITKRFGYTSKTEMYNGSVLQANNGDSLFAVMDGTVTVKDSDVIIKTKSAEFTYKRVGRIRVKDGDKVKTGEEIGTVSSSDGQEVFYYKLKNKKKKEWAWVNVGFYLPNVEYSQTTSVLTTLDGDLASKVNAIKALIKKKLPEVTDNGLAAMFGNFATESNINPKRAEGDYLSPPVGASENSWDDPAWLSINGPTIYNGRYPNIVHRGLGLGQWTDTADGSTRHTLLLEYAKSKGKKWYDLELQINFILEGDSPYYINIAKSILTSNDDVGALTQSFLVNWEGNAGDKLLERQNNARQIHGFLKSGIASGVPTDGDYAHPFNTPYTVLQPYGFTPWSTGAGAYLYAASGGKHTGVDIQANNVSDGADTPIFSMTDGKVYSVSYSSLGGHAITIQPDFGGYLYYGHLKYAPSLSAGDTVKKGQQIAVLGHSGLTDIYHIHLEYSTSPLISTGLYDKDPSFLFQKSGTLQANQVISPK